MTSSRAGRLLSTEVIDSLDRLCGIASEWHSVWESDPTATPFHTPGWLIPWTRHLWGGGKLQILAVREASRLVAVAPFFLWGYGSEPEILRLSFLGSGVSDYLGMTCDPGYTDTAADAVMNWIAAPHTEWDLADLQELRPASPLLRAASRISASFSAEISECSVSPVLSLHSSIGDQLNGVAAPFRRSLRAGEKRLRSAGRLEVVTADVQSLPSLLDHFYSLHTRRWQERGETGVFATDPLHSFYNEVAERLCQSGMLRLYFLVLNDRHIAAQFNFAAKRRVYAYAAGFDPEFERGSPGAVLLLHTIAAAIGEGAREFDFLRHAETFKYDWGAVDTTNSRLRLRNQRVRAA